MRKLKKVSTLLLTLIIFCGFATNAQDFSNKGKDFWVAYGYHQIMVSGNQQQMVLYFAAEQTSNVTVSIPSVGYTQSYTVPANSTITSNPIPKAGAQDVRLITESTSGENKGIHITSDKPIVAYAHIYNSSVSGASILFPTATLGKEYYSINYTNISNTSNSNCWFYAIAADTGTTTVEITPSAATINHPAGVPFTITLTQGQVYNVMGQFSGSNGVDLTGSKIRSINNGSGCKRLAVFSGSGRISITCNNSSSSSDNYMVQAFPKTAWGKRFLTTSTGGVQANNTYRICVSDPTTAIILNGAPITYPLTNNFYYEIPASSVSNLIEGDKPFTVAQYITSQAACGNGAAGDPEVIYLSPVEQNINKVLWNATPNYNITQHYYNVIIPNTGTAISSFRLDNNPVSPFFFSPHPQDPGYSYLTRPVSAGQHIIESDSGFNAIAYGYGQFESYGYNAGTNIKDIFQYISVQNEFATVNFPSTCRGTPFYFSMTFPYQPTSIKWVFGAALNGLGFVDVIDNAPIPTSTTIVNGRTLYIYKLPGAYSIPSAGVFPIKVVATNPTPDGCGGVQEIDFDVQVFNPPVADFKFTTDGCLANPVLFFDSSNTDGRAVISRYWNFGDAATATVKDPTHLFTAPGAYNVKYSLITDIGCIADTMIKVVTVNNPPVANFSIAGTQCANKVISFTDNSSASNATITTWAWDFGDGQTSSATSPTHTYATPGNYTVTLSVTTATGCPSLPFTTAITIHPDPVSNFTFPNGICLPGGAAQFTDQSTVASGNTVTNWLWDFGDASATSSVQSPLHNYTTIGPYNATLIVTTNNGCTDTTTKNINTIFEEPIAAFDPIPTVCIGSLTGFSDASTAPGSTVTGWNWDFGDATTSTMQNPSHVYSTAGTFTITLRVTSAAGCNTVSKIATGTITVVPLPTAAISGNATVCQNSISPFITFTGVIGTPPFTFSYNINGGAPQIISTSSTSSSVTLPVPTNSVGTFKYNLTLVQEGSGTNCAQAQTGSATVVVQPLPTATITGTNTVCLNSTSPSVTFTGAGGTAPYTFTYTINGGAPQLVSTSSGSSVTISAPTGTAGSFVYDIVSVKESSVNNCNQSISGSATITVNALPTATIAGTTGVCLNGNSPTVTFTGNGGTLNYTFSYNINGGPVQTISTTSGNSVTITAPTATAGIYIYNLLSVTEGSNVGCSQLQSGNATIDVYPLPTVDFNFTQPTCDKNSIQFADASVANAGNITAWQWSFGDPVTGASNSSSMQNPAHNFSAAGSYNVSLSVTTNNGCSTVNFVKQVVVNEKPSAGFIPPQVCLSDPLAPFSDTSKIANGSITGWLWDFGDGNANAGNPNTSTLQNPLHQYSAVGTYMAILVATSNSGCKDTVQHTFVVNGSVPVAGFMVQNNSPICSNQPVVIKDASSVDFGGIIKVEIYWDYLNNPTLKTIDDSPTPGKQYSNVYPEFGAPFSRTYQIRYVAYSGINCVNTTTKDITQLATPTIVFNPIPFVCDREPSFIISQASLQNSLTGSGVFSGPGITPSGLFAPADAGVGLHTLRYTFTSTDGCINFKEQTIEVNASPGVNAGPDKAVLEGGQVMLTPVQNIGYSLTYLWSPATDLNNPAIAFPIASPKADMTYTLTVTTDKGCSASDAVFVKVLLSVAIPNIFSPNGDGVHDRWEIKYLESYPGATVDVYNRYGQIIYHSVGYTKPWDGTVNGKPVPVGTYYYIVNPKNGRSPISGYVDVIR